MKVVDTLNKFKADTFNFSRGVCTAYNEGIMTILTFSEKLEKGITELFPYRFDVSPAIFKFMDKHFQIADVSISDDEMEFMFVDTNNAFYTDKAFIKIKDHIYKNDQYYCVKVEFGKTELYKKSLEILNTINDLNHSESKEFKMNIYDDINTSEIPLVIDDERFFVRLSKSTFQNVTKGDTAIVKCVPYNDKNSTVFLTATTVNKSEYQIINVFNVLYLLERDE
jgi:hypothetical protein